MLKVFLFCFSIFLVLLGKAQSDSLTLTYDLIRKSDSLVQIKEYELARDYLNWTNVMLSKDRMKVMTREEASTFYYDYNNRRNAIEKHIKYDLTDTMRNKYRMNRLRQNRVLGYYLPKNYIADVVSYDLSTIELAALIDTVILLMPVDTIDLGSNNDGTFQLTTNFKRNLGVFAKWSNYKWLGSPNANPWRQVKRYTLKDSTLFQGVIRESAGALLGSKYTEIGTKVRWVYFKDGLPYADSTFSYRQLSHYDMSDSVHKAIIATYPISRGFVGSYYKSGFQCNLDSVIVDFYPNGDTSMYYAGNHDNHYTIYYDYDNRVILETGRITEIDTPFIFINDYQNINGGTKNKQYRRNWIADESTFLQFELNQNGDTTVLKRMVNEERSGLSFYAIIEAEDSILQIKSLWRNDSLISFVNDDILYLDKRFNRIDQSTFLDLSGRGIDDYPESRLNQLDRVLMIEGETYRFIAYHKSLRQLKKSAHKKYLKKLDKLVDVD